MIKIVPIREVKPSTYNPRKADPRRLDLIELSLRKLGWLVPIYADADGEILSGHQRHHVAERMGATHVPVAYTGALDLATRKAINITFNRGTNDLSESATPKNLTEALERSDVFKLAEAVPDRDIHSPDWFRCARGANRSVAELVKINTGRWVHYALTVTKTLRMKGITMPLVCTPDGIVVNGIGRLQDAAERSVEQVHVVEVSHEEAALSSAFLNQLSMDFDVHGRYADELRYNSFRRYRTRGRIISSGKNTLGMGFVISLLKNKAAKDLDITAATDRKRWREFYGATILDFGAGRLDDTNILREYGFDVTAFEPFVPVHLQDIVDTEKSREVVRAFLKRVADGTTWTSIILASVLNSVPFLPDRKKVVTLVASLTTDRTTVHACAASMKKATVRYVEGRGGISENDTTRTQFSLDYEANVVLGEIGRAPKVQKFHPLQEFEALWKERFEVVKGWEARSLANVMCQRPKPVSPADLDEAIGFEFDLLHPNGERLGLADEARKAWEKRAEVLRKR